MRHTFGIWYLGIINLDIERHHDVRPNIVHTDQPVLPFTLDLQLLDGDVHQVITGEQRDAKNHRVRNHVPARAWRPQTETHAHACLARRNLTDGEEREEPKHPDKHNAKNRKY